MGMCKKCGEVFSSRDMVEGYCMYCVPANIAHAQKERFIQADESRKAQTEKTRQEKLAIEAIMLTTETTLDVPVTQRIDIISSQCIYGIMILKDIFQFVRDIVGGRVKSLEDALRDANIEINNDLKAKAYALGGNAVIGVRIEHTYNNANNGSILSVFATGTVVKLDKGSN